MKKKFLNSIIVIVVIITFIMPTNIALGATQVLFLDTFDEGTNLPNGFKDKTPGIADGVVTIEKSPASSNNALKFVDENNTANFFISGPAVERKFAPQSEKVEISLDIIPLQITDHFNILIMDSVSGIVGVSIQIIENGTIRLYWNDSANSYEDIGVYNAEELLNFRIVMDIKKNVFDLYLNQEQKATSALFYNRSFDSGIKYGKNECEKIDSIWMQTGVGVGTFFVDNIKLTDLAATGSSGDGEKMPIYAISDVVGTELEEPVKFLQSLFIMQGYEDGTFLPDQKITRAEFSKAIIAMLDAPLNSKSSSKFSDVTNDYWAVDYINTVSTLGYVNGYSNGEFRPEEAITYNDAIKIIVSALGYTPQAIAYGGYPNGYRQVAGNIHILRNVSYEEFLSRGTVAKMLANAVEADIMDSTGFGDQLQYTILKGVTLLTKRDIYKARGIVTATQDTTLFGESNLLNGQVEINKTIYKTKFLDTKNYLGQDVTYYYKTYNNQETPSLVHASLNSINRVLSISSEDIDTKATTNSKFVYNSRNDQTNSIAIPNTIQVLYNGKAYYNFDSNSNTFKPNYGNVTFIDNNGDSKYEIAKITSYEPYCISSLNKIDQIIIDKYGKQSINLTPDKEISYSIKRDNLPIEFGDLKEGDILSVAKSLDGKVVNIIATNTKITSEINGTFKDSKERQIISIEDTDYVVMDNIKEVLEFGIVYDFYFDAFGRIGGVEKTVAMKNYGYLLDFFVDNSLEQNKKFKIFDGTLGVVTFDAIDKIKIDNEICTTAVKLQNCEQLYDNGKPKPQLIVYEINEQSKIVSLKTAVDSTLEKYNPDEFSLVANSDGMKFDQNRINTYFTVTKDTLVLYVPENLDETQMEVMNTDFFVSGQSYKMELYDAQRFGDVNVAVIRMKTDAWLHVWSKFGIVSSISTSINEDGENIYILHYYDERGSLVSIKTVLPSQIKNADINKYWTYENYQFNQLKCGDLIQLQANSKNELIEFKLLFSSDKKDLFDLHEGGDEQIPDIHLVFAKIVDANGKNIKFQVGDSPAYSYDISNTKFFEHHRTQNLLKKSTKDQANVGMNVVIAFHRFTPVMAMLIEE